VVKDEDESTREIRLRSIPKVGAIAEKSAADFRRTQRSTKLSSERR